MASILNTDLGDLYDQWGQRVAFNEGYRKGQLNEARSAGAEAASFGVDRETARDRYFQQMQARREDAAEFLASESASVDDAADDVTADLDDIGEVMNGEETLGMESCVSDETIDVHNPIVMDMHESWDICDDEERARWIELDMVEADYMNYWNDSPDFEINVNTWH